MDPGAHPWRERPSPGRLDGLVARFDAPIAPTAPVLLRRALAVLPPASGGAVMGTGIVSIALLLDGRTALSRALMWIALAVWAALALLAAARLACQRPRMLAELSRPGCLSGVAGTCVLGTRLTLYGWHWAGIALLVAGAALGIGLLGEVLEHWHRPVAGAGFLVTVTTEAVAVLCSGVAIAEGRAWPATVAAGLLAIGISGYPLVLRDFDLGQVLHGHGDQWVVGGAPAIDALSAGVLVLASESTHALAGLREAFSVAGVVMLVVALAWLPVLVAGELARPRPGFHSPRWATVFPLGMYAAAAFVVGSAAGHAWMTGFARIWVWIAFAAWAVVGAAGVRRGVALLRRGGPPSKPSR